MDYNSHSWRIIVSDLIELNMQQEMQFRYCPLNWRLAEMKDFYVKKRSRERYAVFNNVIWCHLLHLSSFFILQKTKNIIFTSCNFSYLSWNNSVISVDKHTQFFKYINVFPDIFNIPEAWRFTVVIFYIGDTGWVIIHIWCSISKLIKFH